MAGWQRRGIFGLLSNEARAVGAGETVGGESELPASITAENRPQVELAISSMLRYGVLISCVLIVAGMVALLLSLYGSLDRPTLSSMLSSGAEGAGVPRSPSEVLYGLLQGDPNAIVALGLLVLMVTPIVPVVLSAVSFLLERDKPYILVTLFVLAILVASFFLGASR